MAQAYTRQAPPNRVALSVALLGVWLHLNVAPAWAQQQPVDLELVLAVDASASVSQQEFDLQARGLAEAFRHPAVGQAIRAAGDLGLAVAVIQWSDRQQHLVSVNWSRLHDRETVAQFAKAVEAAPRRLGGNTAIGSAIKFAVAELNSNGFHSQRRIIDISGDGPNNQGPAAFLVRKHAIAQGITINGLAILNEDPTLDRYYGANVIGGTGAFVMAANDYEAYRDAILAKLIREIAGAPTATGPAPPDRPVMAAGN